MRSSARYALMALVLSMAAVVVVHVVACMVIHPPTLSAESSDHHTMDHLPKAVLGVSDSILALGALALLAAALHKQLESAWGSVVARVAKLFPGRSPPSGGRSSFSLPMSLCVIRC